MIRKLALVGMVLVVGRGSVAQLSAAIMLSFGFFALQMYTWPYKIEQDNLLRAATELHVFIVICTALVLKNDLSWEIIGVDVYDMILFISFLVLVPGAALLAVISKLRFVQKVLMKQEGANSGVEKRKLSFQLQALGLANESDRVTLRRYINGWSVSKKYAAFLSHFKNEAAAEARILKSELVRTLRAREDQIFLDSDNLSDLRELLNCVAESDALILIYTNSVLTRPWCLLELVTAVQNNVPIITVRAANVFAGDVNDIDGILSNLPAYLAEKNPMAEETLRAFGHDAMGVGNDLRSAFQQVSFTDALFAQAEKAWADHAFDDAEKLIAQLEAEKSRQAGIETISFDPHQSAAMLQNQVGQIATALVRRACPENRSLLADIESSEVEPWPTTRQYAVYIVYDEKSQDITPHVEQIKQWLVDNTDLDENQVLLQGDEAAAEISTTGPMTAVSKHSDSVLLIQSAKVLHEPRSLVCLYAGVSHSVPLVPVVLTKSKPEDAALVYDFVAAKSLMENLSAGIGLEASSVLEQATAVPADEVGLALSRVLPNVISKPLGLSSSEGEFNAQMTEIEATLRRSINAGVEQLQVAFKRIDVNGDGSISRDEILRAVRKDRGIGEMLGLRGATGEDMAFEAGRLFEAMDSDGDHHIDLKEFIGYLSGKDQRSIPGDDEGEVTLVPGDARP